MIDNTREAAVSMYLDIKQAAELIASALVYRTPVEIAKQINEAGRINGLKMMGPTGQLVDWWPLACRIVKEEVPTPYGSCTTEKIVLEGRNLQSAEGEEPVFVPYHTVSIADIVASPFLRLATETQNKILAEHIDKQSRKLTAPLLNKSVKTLGLNAVQKSPSQKTKPHKYGKIQIQPLNVAKH